MVLAPITVAVVAAWPAPARAADLVGQLLDPTLCDGFDFPVGDADGQGDYLSKSDGRAYDGWYVATHVGDAYDLGVHTGEDWNGKGGANTDLGQPVHATASGRVTASGDYGAPWGNIVVIEHRFLDNGRLRTVWSAYAHLDHRAVKTGDRVQRRQFIGTIGTGNGAYPAHLHFEIRGEKLRGVAPDYWPSSHDKDRAWVLERYEPPTPFVDARRRLLVPAREATALIAIKKTHRLIVVRDGKPSRTFAMALGQSPDGHKQKEGDNRTPEGEYRVIQKAKPPFGGDYAEYLGAAWLRINYPNSADARAGEKSGTISEAERATIVSANEAGTEPPKTTALGGGIGIHGWSGDWKDDGKQDLTWGCISLRNRDVTALYDLVTLGTTVVIHP